MGKIPLPSSPFFIEYKYTCTELQDYSILFIERIHNCNIMERTMFESIEYVLHLSKSKTSEHHVDYFALALQFFSRCAPRGPLVNLNGDVFNF